MSSLKKCLKRLGFEQHEAAILRGMAREYVEDGESPQVAAISAIEDYLLELEQTRADIIRQIEAKGGVVPQGERAGGQDTSEGEDQGRARHPAQEAEAERPAAEPGKKLSADQVTALATEFSKTLLAGTALGSINEARAIAARELNQPIKPGTLLAKQTDEALELGIVLAAREIVKRMRAQGATDKEIYAALVELYKRQPNLAVRTSTSVRDQAYSTPVPLAFLASRLAGIDEHTRVLEPTAGNGMLLIEADPDRAVANELNSDRAAALEAQGFTPSRIDATALPSMEKVDAVIANPPFGYVKDEHGRNREWKINERYTTNQIDHAIAMKALEAMADDGRAVLIVAAPHDLKAGEARAEAYNGRNLRAFYFTLYGAYNVVDHFTVAGDLYARQGAAWPVDVLVISGRGKSARTLPAAQVPKLYESWEELAEKLDVARRLDETTRGARRPSTEAAAQGARERAPEPAALGGGAARAEGPVQRPGGGGSAPVRGGRASEQPAAGGLDVGAPGEPREPARTGELPGADRGPDTGVPRQLEDIEKAPSRRTISTPFKAGDKVRFRSPSTNQQVYEIWQVSDDGARLKLHEPAPKHWRNAEDFELVEARPLDETEKVQREQVVRRREAETEHQVHYEPSSKVSSIGTLVPANMKSSIAESLAALKERVGDLDEYVAKELDYPVGHIGRYFSAEQVDALALALDALGKRAGFIVGDATGVGKGRVVAGMIRWAMKHGKTPIFVTEKPNLYGDMVRDLTDIGMPHVRILMTNSNAEIPLDDEAAAWWAEWEEEALAAKAAGERPRRRPPVESRPGRWLKTTARQPKVLQEVMEKGSLGDYDVIFTTYSQMQTVQGKRTVRMDFLERFVQGGMLIMDESHNAGGDAQESDAEQAGRREDEGLKRSVFARGLIRLADGVFYSSATYAKRPEVMDLYAATDMALAVDSPAALPEAIRAGGVPLQQVVASMLAKAGQYIRRERSFAGVRYDTRTVAVNREIAERISGLMRAISAFDTAKAPAIARMRKEIRKEAQQVTQDGSAGEAGVSSTNFTSIMHNMVNQMLLALKVVPVADLAIEVAKRGERPVLTVANTMGSFIKAYVEEHELKAGDSIAISFKDLLLRYLERSREVLVGDPFGKKERHRLTDEELGVAAVNLYNRIREDILASDFSEIPLSPIDYLKHRIERAGLTFGEITGRHHRIDYSGPEPIYAMRPASDSSVAGRRVTIKKFNDGLIDVLLLNQAGATGLSLHASEKFKDQRRRHMVIVQAEANIDTHMQMLGRVHRTGQVVEPVYTQLVADIPAEKRPAAVLAKKMASLNANTTAARGSALTAREVVDFMNEYGDETAAQLMEDHEEWHKIMGSPLKGDDEGAGLSRKDAIRKLTGRIPLLRIAEQEELYNMLEDEYRALVEEKDRLGENLLEAKTLELDAKVLKAVPITQGGGGSSPFAAGATAEIVDVKKIGKPFTSEELLGILRRELGQPEDVPFSVLSRAGSARAEELRESLAAEWQPYLQETLDSLHDQRHRDATGARLRGAYERLDHILAQAALGRPLVLDTRFGKVPAVVTKVEKKGNPKNPAALGAWKFTFAVADAIRRVTIPASRMYAAGDQPQNAVDTGHVVLDEYRPGDWGGKRTLELFDEAQSHSREQRVIITGNLLAGFGKFSNGQIIHFTTDSGEIRQGILMPRRFDLDRALNTMPIEFPNAESAIGFLDRMAGQAVLESVEGKLFRLTGSGNEYRLVVAKAREKGGVIYLNKEIIRAAGRDFVSAGASMRLDEMDRRTAVKVLQAIMDAGHRVHTKAFRQEAKDYLEANAPRTERPAFRREVAVAGMPVKRVRELAARISGAWANAPRFVVTETPAQWPFDAPDDAKGAFWRGTVYLAADHLAGERDVQFTVFHETLGHYGLRGFFGKDLDPVLRELWIRNAKLRRAAADWMSKNEKRPEWSAEDYRLQAIEEALADLAGSGRTFNGLRKLIVKIQDWLRRRGFDWVADWLERLSDAEALSVLAQARSFVTEGGKAHIYTPELEASLSRLGRWYYSELAEQIAGLTLKTATPEQWRGIVQNMKGVKKEEVEWTGVLDWLAMQQGKVSREAVLDYLAENGVRVEEVVLDTRESVERDAERAAEELHARGYDAVYDEVADGVRAPVAITRRSDDQSYAPDPSGDDLPLSELPPDVRELAERLFRETEQKRKHLVVRYDDEKLILPGGKNYRELLLTYPTQASRNAERFIPPSVDDLRATYSSPHWPVRNVLAHVRLNERADAEGKRVLFIEEIQSDWHQRGREHGYRPTKQDITARLVGKWDSSPNSKNKYQVEINGVDIGYFAANSESEAIEIARAREAQFTSKVPNAPFKTTWPALVLKRMIRYAAENGFDKIAWTTGAQQVARYENEFRRAIDSVEWLKVGGGRKAISAKKNGRIVFSGQVDGDGRFVDGYIPAVVGKSVAEVFGKDIAAEIEKKAVGEITGSGLTIGGEGMKAFYDRIVPNVANDVLKKLGGERVITIPVKIGGEKSEQPGFEITPALREKAMEGVPLFARRQQGPRESWIESYRQAARKVLDRLEATLEPIRRLPQAPQYLKDRYLALGKIAKVDEIARGIRSAFSEATEEDKRAAYEYLTTFDATPDAIKDPAVRAKAAEVKRLINSVGDALVARWMLSPEAREAHRDAYLPRLYLRHLLTEADWKALGSGKKVSDMGYLKQRKDIPEEVRRVILGEITDPGFLSAVAIGKPLRDMALLDWLDTISQNKEWVLPGSVVEFRGKRVSAYWLREEAARLRQQARYYQAADAQQATQLADEMDQVADAALEGMPADRRAYKQMPNTARYGRLRGLWVRREIYDDLMGVHDFIPEDPGWFANIFGYGGIGTKVTQLWKMGKVGLNPPAQVRNFMSNMVLLQLSGVPLHRLPTLFVRALRQIADDGQYWRIAKKYGVTESTFTAQELYRMKRELLDLEARTGRLGPLGKLHMYAARVADFAGDAYQAMEAIGKTMKIIHGMEHEGLGEADAAMEAQKWLFDYSLVARSVRYARNAPIGIPFLTFYVKVLPRLLEVAMLHPQRYLPWVVLFYGFPQLLGAMFDVDDDDIEKLKQALPDWLRKRGHTMLLPWKDEQGRWQVFDVGYFFPWVAWTEVARDLYRGELGQAVMDAGILSGPITDLVVAIKTGKDPFTGRDIWDKNETPRQQIISLLNYLWSVAAPPFLTDKGFVGHMMRAYTGETNKYGDPRSTYTQAALRLFGINIYAMHPEQSRLENARKMMFDIHELDRKLRMRLQDRSLSEEQRERIIEEYRTERKKRMEEIREYLEKSEVHPNLRTR